MRTLQSTDEVKNSGQIAPYLFGYGKKQNRVFILELSCFPSIFNANNLKKIIEKSFSSLRILDLRGMEGIECRENDECFLKEIADFASAENIKKLWENHSNALEEVFVERKDVNIPYDIIKLIEWHCFGILSERVVDDLSEKFCVRYPAESEKVYPIQILIEKRLCICQHVKECPWILM